MNLRNGPKTWSNWNSSLLHRGEFQKKSNILRAIVVKTNGLIQDLLAPHMIKPYQVTLSINRNKIPRCHNQSDGRESFCNHKKPATAARVENQATDYSRDNLNVLGYMEVDINIIINYL